MAITNNLGQTRVGVRSLTSTLSSSLLTSLYSVYNADSVGLSSLKTSLYASYNGESNTNDSFGSNNGTANGGLTYGTGKIGNAFVGNGSNAYVSLPNDTFKFTNAFSINVWVNISSSTTNSVFIENYNYPVPNESGYIFEHLSNGNIRFYMMTSPYSPTQLNYSYAGNYNGWHMLTLTKASSSGALKLYIDGVLVTSNNSPGTIYYHTSNYSSIGVARYTGGASGYLENGGKIDALNIWQKELTQSEITELYNSGNGAQYITDNFYKPTPNDALNTYNGTAQGGLTYGVGKVGTAFQFNGTNAYVNLPNNSLNLTGPYSISMWVYFASNPSGETPYLLHSFNGTTSTGFEYRIRAGKPEIGLATTGGLYTYWYASNELFNTSGWYHLILVKPLNQQPQFYVNGVSTLTGIRVSNATVTEVTYTNPVKCSIGNNVTYLSNYMPNGSKIDALNIWNKVLTSSEITELYNSGNGKQHPF
jgi:hypothetical protein